MEPTYLIWTPRVTRTDGAWSIRFNATPHSALDWPEGGEDFYTQLLRDMGVESTASSWNVVPYRSRYHGVPEAQDWRDRWKRNWRVTITLQRPLASAPTFEEGYEAEAFAAETPLSDQDMRAFVLADFPDRGRAEGARAVIQKMARENMEFELFEVEQSFWQLQIDLGPRDEPFFHGNADAAQRIEAACRDAGGWPTFDERVRVLG